MTDHTKQTTVAIVVIVTRGERRGIVVTLLAYYLVGFVAAFFGESAFTFLHVPHLRLTQYSPTSNSIPIPRPLPRHPQSCRATTIPPCKRVVTRQLPRWVRRRHRVAAVPHQRRRNPNRFATLSFPNSWARVKIQSMNYCCNNNKVTAAVPTKTICPHPTS